LIKILKNRTPFALEVERRKGDLRIGFVEKITRKTNFDVF